MAKINIKQTELITTNIFQWVVDSKFGSLMLNYIFLFLPSSYITKSLTRNISFSETYSNIDFLTNNVHNIV